MLFKRAIAALIAALTLLFAAPTVASADHIDVPGQNDSRIIGWCHLRSAGGWQPYPCRPGERPYLAATEYAGADRDATARIVADAYARGDFQPDTVFVARWEDYSIAAFLAQLTGGTAVLVNGGDGPLDDTSRERAIAAHRANPQALVIFGGDAAINISQRVEIAVAVWWGG